MKKYYRQFFSVILGLCYTTSYADVHVDKLNLENVVIKGKAKRLPVTIVKKRKSLVQESKKVVKEKTSEKKVTEWNSRLKLSTGYFNTHEIDSSTFLSRKDSTYGVLLNHQSSRGHEDIYGYNKGRYEVEYIKSSSDHTPFIKLKTSFLNNTLEIPTPFNYSLGDRKERSQHIELSLEKERVERPYKLYAELDQTQSVEFSSREFDTSFFRLGFLYGGGLWQTAMSLESDSRDADKSFLTKLFFKRTIKVLSEDTKLHAGLGLNYFKLNNSTLNSNGSLAFLGGNNKKEGLAFNPYIQFDHRISSTMVSYISFTQFYDKEKYSESNFEKRLVEMNNNLVQPSLKTESEIGLKKKFFNVLNSVTSLHYTKTNNAHILQDDIRNAFQRLNYMVWNKGREWSLVQSLFVELDDYFKFKNSFSYTDPKWESHSIDFTPYKSKVENKLSFEYLYQNTGVELTHHWYGDRKTYPSMIEIGSYSLTHLSLFYHWNQKIHYRIDFNNLLNEKQEIFPGYSEPGFSGKFTFILEL